MRQNIDPTERALDAYFELDTDQRATFALAVKHVERFAAQIGHSMDYCPPQEETKPKRGRPAGSKNKKILHTETGYPVQVDELELRHNNAARGENL